MNSLLDGIVNAIKHDINNKIKSVIILYKNGEFKTLGRERIKNGIGKL